MLKLLSNPLIAFSVVKTDDLRKFTREYLLTQRIETWQMWAMIMVFIAMFLAAAFLTLV